MDTDVSRGFDRRTCLARGVALATALMCGRDWAADLQPAVPVAPEALQVELLRTGLYLISGGGGNSLLRLSAAGTVLVNGKQDGMYRPLMSQLRKISRLSDLPLRVLLLTDIAAPQAANQGLFAAAGVATLVQQDARSRLVDNHPAGPVIGFEHDYRLHIGGVDVTTVHVGPARTKFDTVVFFPDLKVLALGALYGEAPGGRDGDGDDDLARWSHGLARALQLDFDIAVPNDGPPLARAAVQAFKDRLDARRPSG